MAGPMAAMVSNEQAGEDERIGAPLVAGWRDFGVGWPEPASVGVGLFIVEVGPIYKESRPRKGPEGRRCLERTVEVQRPGGELGASSTAVGESPEDLDWPVQG
jgi:hypothetical protein